MTAADPAQVASTLTNSEKSALLSLPARDRGHLPDEVWWAYYSILDAGLSMPTESFMMVPTPLGKAVIEQLAKTDASGGSPV